MVEWCTEHTRAVSVWLYNKFSHSLKAMNDFVHVYVYVYVCVCVCVCVCV